MALGGLVLYCGFFTLIWEDFNGLPDIDFPFWVPLAFFIIGAVIMLFGYFGFYVVYAEKIKGIKIYIVMILVLIAFILVLSILSFLGSQTLSESASGKCDFLMKLINKQYFEEEISC